MPPAYTVDAALPDEWRTALGLLFEEIAPSEQEARIRNALHMIKQGELDPAGLLVVRGADGLLGVLACSPVPGASGVMWPPRARGAEAERIEDLLVRQGIEWLRARGCKLIQSLLQPSESHRGAPLERNGLAHITSLWYLRHFLDLPAALMREDVRLRFTPYSDSNQTLFHETLLRSYSGTLDCPEVSGVRNLEEVLEAHRAQGAYDPAFWWLALEGDQPVGVLILTELTDITIWEVAYIGIVPEARRRGLGWSMMARALVEAKAAEATEVMVSVDARNDPAWKLYRRVGFETYDRREVYLATPGTVVGRTPF
jgi:ribosomal protein S18 acetylase RimI-like enzyme